MKILTLSNLFPPASLGGYEELCAQVVHDLGSRGHEIVVLTSGMSSQIQSENVDVRHGLNLLRGRHIYEQFQGTREDALRLEEDNANTLRNTCMDANPDVIFVWNLFGMESLVDELVNLDYPLIWMLTDNWLVGNVNPIMLSDFMALQIQPTRQSDKPVVLWPRPDFGRLGQIEIVNRHDVKRTLPGCAICPSLFVQELHHAAGVAFNKIRVIPHGTSSDDGAIERKPRGGSGTFRLLFAGRLVRLKGPHNAIQALSLLNRRKEKDPPATLTLIGDQSDRSYVTYLDELARSLGVRALVTFKEAVTAAELRVAFAQHDALIFSSLYEPFSLTLIEALKAGIPTVASAVGGNFELVEDGVTGYMYPPHNVEELVWALLQILHDPAEAQMRAKLAMDRASGLSTALMVSRVESVLFEQVRPHQGFPACDSVDTKESVSE